MLNLLAKWWIPQGLSDDALRRAWGQLCGAVGIALNVLLFAGKFLAGQLSGSIAITADAFNNLSDAGSSVVTLLGFRLAGMHPDKRHPFGHGRLEYLSGLVVAALILMMGVELAQGSIWKIMNPTEVECSWLTVVILLISVAVKLYMAAYNRTIGRKIKSAAMVATGIDSLSDTVSTLAVLAAMGVSYLTDWHIDGWVGLLVAVFILISAGKAAVETINPLLGQSPEKELVDRIRAIALDNEVVRGVHDLVVHDYGPGRMMISLHAEVPSSGDLVEMHEVIDDIENRLEEELHCRAVIHMDPIVTDDKKTEEMRLRVAELVFAVDERATIHDFRMTAGPGHTNLIFDVAVPFDEERSAEELEEEICACMKMLDGDYRAVIKLEHNLYE